MLIMIQEHALELVQVSWLVAFLPELSLMIVLKDVFSSALIIRDFTEIIQHINVLVLALQAPLEITIQDCVMMSVSSEMM